MGEFQEEGSIKDRLALTECPDCGAKIRHKMWTSFCVNTKCHWRWSQPQATLSVIKIGDKYMLPETKPDE